MKLAAAVALMMIGMAAMSPVKKATFKPEMVQEQLPILNGYECLRLANLDLHTLPPKRQRYARYLTAGHEPLAAERLKLYQGVNWLIHHLTFKLGFYPPFVVENSNGTVFRILLDDYNIDPKAWDSLAENGSGPVAEAKTPDGYYHLYAEQAIYKDVEKEIDCPPYQHEGKTYTRKRVTEKVFDKRVTQFISLPSLAVDGGALIADTIQCTGSKSPILRTDWFIYWASQAPAYYDFLGLGKTLKDIEEQAGVDVKKAEAKGAAVYAIVLDSNVAFHNRQLRGYRVVVGPNGGWFWISDDVLASTNQRDFLGNLLNVNPDAHEIIFSLPNGLQAYAITDGQGKRLDVVNSEIALDRETKLRDKNLGIRNCMLCHLAGMRDINDEVRALGKLTVNLPEDGVLAGRIRDLFFAVDVGQVTKRDSEAFRLASMAGTGIEAAANGSNLEAIFRRYWDEPVTLERLANEVGCEPDRLQAAVQRPAAVGSQLGTSNVEIQLDGLTRTQSRPMQRSQVEKAFANASLLVTQGVPIRGNK
jgi:hypothetical protein